MRGRVIENYMREAGWDYKFVAECIGTPTFCVTIPYILRRLEPEGIVIYAVPEADDASKDSFSLARSYENVPRQSASGRKKGPEPRFVQDTRYSFAPVPEKACPARASGAAASLVFPS